MDLFHGTGGAIEGGVVKPGKNHFYGHGAYATTYRLAAEYYAQMTAHQEGRLFGTVYRVNPVSKNPKVEYIAGDEDYVIDPKGLKVEEVVDFPINERAVLPTQ